MLIEKVPVTAETYGGYVNVSRQDIDWTQPGIMDIIINDLAGQYAIQTEDATAIALEAAATAGHRTSAATPTAAGGRSRRSGLPPQPSTPRPPATAA